MQQEHRSEGASFKNVGAPAERRRRARSWRNGGGGTDGGGVRRQQPESGQLMGHTSKHLYIYSPT